METLGTGSSKKYEISGYTELYLKHKMWYNQLNYCCVTSLSTLERTPLKTPLLPLSAFLAIQPGVTWFTAPESAQFVARSADVRWKIQREISNAESGVAYSRREALYEQGVNANEEDSKNFATGLVQALEEHLTPRDLRNLAEAFNAAYQKTEFERVAFTASVAIETHTPHTK